MTSRRSRGFPKAFSTAQNGALRDGLRELVTKRGSQSAAGGALGFTQQAVNRLLRSDDAGFSYESATRLVQVLGYATVDTFFRARGIAMERSA